MFEPENSEKTVDLTCIRMILLFLLVLFCHVRTPKDQFLKQLLSPTSFHHLGAMLMFKQDIYLEISVQYLWLMEKPAKIKAYIQ